MPHKYLIYIQGYKLDPICCIEIIKKKYVGSRIIGHNITHLGIQ